MAGRSGNLLCAELGAARLHLVRLHLVSLKQRHSELMPISDIKKSVQGLMQWLELRELMALNSLVMKSWNHFATGP